MSSGSGDQFTLIRNAYPRWEAWEGISGLLYARRRAEPKVLVRDVDVLDLGVKIAQAEKEIKAGRTPESVHILIVEDIELGEDGR